MGLTLRPLAGELSSPLPLEVLPLPAGIAVILLAGVAQRLLQNPS